MGCKLGLEHTLCSLVVELIPFSSYFPFFFFFFYISVVENDQKGFLSEATLFIFYFILFYFHTRNVQWCVACDGVFECKSIPKSNVVCIKRGRIWRTTNLE